MTGVKLRSGETLYAVSGNYRQPPCGSRGASGSTIGFTSSEPPLVGAPARFKMNAPPLLRLGQSQLHVGLGGFVQHLALKLGVAAPAPPIQRTGFQGFAHRASGLRLVGAIPEPARR